MRRAGEGWMMDAMSSEKSTAEEESPHVSPQPSESALSENSTPSESPMPWQERLAFVAFWVGAFYLAVFTLSYLFGHNPFDLTNFRRWDSGLYEKISRSGYFLSFSPKTGEIQGNCGWFPLYPLLVRILREVLPLSFSAAAFTVSAIAASLSAWAFSHLMDEARGISRDVGMFFFLFFPGSLFLATAYPLSLCVLFGVLSYWALLRRRWLVSGVCCFFACASYSTGFMTCVVLGIFVLWEAWEEKAGWKSALTRLLQTSVLGSLGFIAVQAAIFAFTGNPTAFFETQAKYGHGLHNPLATLIRFIGRTQEKSVSAAGMGFISLIFAVLAVILLTLAVRRGMLRTKGTRLGFLCLSVTWLFLLVMGAGVAPCRQYLLCSGASLILGDRRAESGRWRWFLALLAGAALILETKYFLENRQI